MATPDSQPDYTGVAAYRRFRSALQTGTFPPAYCQHLLACLDQWQAGARLDVALEFTVDPHRFSRNGKHGLRLNNRDDVLHQLASHATGSPWRRAQTIAGWLTRYASGDRLTELPADTMELLAVVGHLSARQIHRVLSGDRSA